MNIDFSELDDEPTVSSPGQYRPEGNEAGVLREYHFTLDPLTLTEGLCFGEEEEATYVPPHR